MGMPDMERLQKSRYPHRLFNTVHLYQLNLIGYNY